MADKLNLEIMSSSEKQLNSLQTFIDNFSQNEENNVYKLKARLLRLDGYYDNYFNALNKLKESNIDDAEVLQNLDIKFNAFESEFFDVKALFEEQIDKLEFQAQPIEINRLPPNNLGSRSAVKLPKIELPHFNGEFDLWIKFRSCFDDLVVKNLTLSNIQRFHYLNGVLGEKAKKVIVKFDLSFDSFPLAWKALCQRYDNNVTIIDTHISKMYQTKSIIKATASGLQELLDEFNVQLQSLRKLGQEIDKWDMIIIHLFSQKLDIETRSIWETVKVEDDVNNLPTWSQMSAFIQKRCDVLLAMEGHNVKIHHGATSRQQTTNRPTNKAFVVSDKNYNPSCRLCKKQHWISSCPELLKLDIDERYNKIKELFLCLNCMRPHLIKNCISKSSCRICNKKHHTLLHMDNENQKKPESVSQDTTKTKNDVDKSNQKSDNSEYAAVCYHNNDNIRKEILLSTALILIEDANGKFITCRALLDSGSQCHFITTRLVKKLNVDQVEVNSAVSGINNKKTKIQHKISAKVASRHSKFNENLQFYVVPEISNNIPSSCVNISKWTLPLKLKLADPEFNISNPVDILLGAEIFFHLIEDHQVELGSNLPILRKTVFGYIVSGSVETPIKNHHSFFITGQMEQNLDQQIKKFWEIEACEQKPALTQEEKDCERIYNETTTRNESGRYVVQFPLKKSPDQLGDSRKMAMKRFLYLERKFEKNPELKEKYLSFMREYETLGHMQLAENDQQNDKPEFFMPHHAVFKPTSTTTKIRTVFDGSAKTSNGISLNDILMVGPTVQHELFDIVLRFRKYQFVYTADLEKMYRQIEVHPDFTSLQKIFWREDPTNDIKQYELKTVTYGTSSAPYLATKTIIHLAKDSEKKFSLASEVASRDFYVDDLLSGSNNFNEASETILQLINMFKDAGMNLRKWISNSTNLLSSIPESDKENVINETIRTLGLIWHPTEDMFTFEVTPLNSEPVYTKRSILSDIAKLFDPLGLVAPIIVIAKGIMQRLWLEKLDWDETLPPEILSLWTDYRNDLPKVNDIKFNRWICPPNAKNLQLHGFADASKTAYGACVFIRSINEHNQPITHLVCSKSRIAPLKTITIPRMELMAALLLSRLVTKVMTAMDMKFENIFLWSDSTIVLTWIKLPPYRLTIFVANRTTEIQELTSEMIWKHISGKDNPADILSRGAMPSDLLVNTLWWHGPSFLKENKDNWPAKIIQLEEDKIPEMENQTFVATTVTKIKDFININYYSDLLHLQHVMGYCIRFINNAKGKSKSERQNGRSLTSTEMEHSMKALVKLVQYGDPELHQQIHDLRKNSDHSKKHSKTNSTLSLFLDNDGLVRVGGRITNSQLDYNAKHPYFLPKHHLTDLIIEHTHLQNLHGGIQSTLASVRERFWPVNATNTVKRIIHRCIPCFRINPKLLQQRMGDIPSNRLEIRRTFNTTGIDFCGPFLVRHKYQRKGTCVKMYICIFICYVTKAVHLELVEDLTSASFIATLKRFVARRGKPAVIWSDNATNFIGASSELRKLLQQFLQDADVNIQKFCSNEGIDWKNIPPRSPHFGGIWESNIKILKNHLKKVIGSAELMFEQLFTLIVEIEGIMNSRPLTPLSNDCHDLEPLTPGHFITGGPINSIIEPIITQPENRLKYWQRVTKMVQHFWQRFSKEYLQMLQQRQKWNNEQPNLKLDDLVLIHDDGLPPTKWMLGRVCETVSGSDGKVRVVLLQTKCGKFKRAIVKLAKLPI